MTQLNPNPVQSNTGTRPAPTNFFPKLSPNPNPPAVLPPVQRKPITPAMISGQTHPSVGHQQQTHPPVVQQSFQPTVTHPPVAPKPTFPIVRQNLTQPPHLNLTKTVLPLQNQKLSPSQGTFWLKGFH